MVGRSRQCWWSSQRCQSRRSYHGRPDLCRACAVAGEQADEHAQAGPADVGQVGDPTDRAQISQRAESAGASAVPRRHDAQASNGMMLPPRRRREVRAARGQSAREASSSMSWSRGSMARPDPAPEAGAPSRPRPRGAAAPTDSRPSSAPDLPTPSRHGHQADAEDAERDGQP